MRQATRQFLEILSRASGDAQVVKVLPVAIDYAKPNECFQNCIKFLDENSDYYLRSGWLVGEYWGVRGTAIMPHYWVCEANTQTHYDVTPIENSQTFEYVLDMSILYSIPEEPKITVPVSLKLNSDGALFARMGIDEFFKLECLQYDELFKLAAVAND